MRNILLTISYDGKAYHGWQVQQNALTVQQVFQTALEKIIGKDYTVKGCSRTDSGVHANMYCISVKTSHRIPAERLKCAMNRFLPQDIVVLQSREVDSEFHARYSCKSKEYVYKIWNSEQRNPFLNGYALHYRYKLDENLLNRAAQAYVGKHDFTSFCTLDKREKGDLTRNVKSFSVTRNGNLVEMKVEADGFLYNMVRIMVGTLLRVAQGKIGENEITDIINAKNRKAAGPTAPACGLYLNRVNY
ncbi:tRNA pseudouridine(38-40) synthase TruA [Ruminococcus sp. zg-924]|nr:tRNA pseudouridine(38-40) synthase TruA [Ruminococcus sp. zg-924]MCQ4114458.1 tRNA pseudouridine(38-40) synthase TruA [Ruminococcus sp. zg-921]